MGEPATHHHPSAAASDGGGGDQAGDPDGGGAARVGAPDGPRNQSHRAGEHGARRVTAPVTFLTFDDGPNGRDTSRLLDVLAELDIRAVFCVVGECIRAPGGAELL